MMRDAKRAGGVVSEVSDGGRELCLESPTR